jgi:hypothetical protein
MELVETIDLQHVTADKYLLKDINKNNLIEELLEDKHIRLTDDVNSSIFEDTLWKPKHEGLKVLNQIHSIINPLGLKVTEKWALFHRPFESTNSHKHPESSFGFVYYVQALPGAGNLVFEFDNINTVIPPVENNLLIFPGWCMHKVTRNLSDNTRISLSGNINYI